MQFLEMSMYLLQIKTDPNALHALHVNKTDVMFLLTVEVSEAHADGDEQR